jgi:hypothetical protein
MVRLNRRRRPWTRKPSLGLRPSLLLRPGGAPSAAAAFVGPLDGVTTEAAYSMRRLYSAYSGNAIRLRRDSDDAESDFGFDATDGDYQLVDTAAISTWLGGATGYVVTRYDQSGNSEDETQATSSEQPVYVESGIGGRPAAQFSLSAERLVSSFTFAQPFYWSVVVKMPASFSALACLRATNGDSTRMTINPSRQLQLRCSGIVGGSTALDLSGDYLLAGIGNGASSSVRVNGSEDGTGSPGTDGNSSGDIYTGARQNNSEPFGGIIGETVHAPSASPPSGYEDDVMAYYGIS